MEPGGDRRTLVRAIPVGARVIVLDERVEAALEAARALERYEGIAAVADVKVNLIDPVSYGLLIEGLDRKVHAPQWDGGPLVRSGAEVFMNFEAALAAIRAAAER